MIWRLSAYHCIGRVKADVSCGQTATHLTRKSAPLSIRHCLSFLINGKSINRPKTVVKACNLCLFSVWGFYISDCNCAVFHLYNVLRTKFFLSLKQIKKRKEKKERKNEERSLTKV